MGVNWKQVVATAWSLLLASVVYIHVARLENMLHALGRATFINASIEGRLSSMTIDIPVVQIYQASRKTIATRWNNTSFVPKSLPPTSF